MFYDQPVPPSLQEKQFQAKRAQEVELQRLISQFFVLDKDARHQKTTTVAPALVKGENTIRLFQKEHADILMDLKRAAGPGRIREDDKVFEKLTLSLDTTNALDETITKFKIYLKELEGRRKMVNKRVLYLRSQQVTDAQHQERIWLAMKTVEGLENRLETQMIQFGTICTKNNQLRAIIDALLWDRNMFVTQWDRLIKRLSEGKQIMLDLIEQATITYNQREDWCNKLQVLRTKAFQELHQNSHVMREFCRRMENSYKIKEFLKVKSQKRVMYTLHLKEEEKRKMLEINFKEKLEAYKNNLKDIEVFAGEKSIKQIASKFIIQEEVNLTNFNFVIEAMKELEDMSDRLGFLHLDIDERNFLHQSREAQQSDAIQQLESNLQEAAAETKRKEDEFNDTQSLLNDLLNGVHQLFKICKCQDDPLVKLLGDNTQVTFYNVRLYMQILEARIHQILLAANYKEGMKKPGGTKSVFSSEKDVLEIYPIDKIIRATPCAICMEHDTVSDVIDILQIAWSREKAEQKLADRLKLPEASNRIHTTSHCTLPKARYMMQKRYE